MVHYDVAETIRGQRNQVLQVAFEAHPERFVRGMPVVPDSPREVWINPPIEAPLMADVAL
jgi:putative transposase